jgi:uncharacterized protein YutE (UPF0331/DUF86 family)
VVSYHSQRKSIGGVRWKKILRKFTRSLKKKKKIRKDLYKGYNSIERDDFIAVIDNSIGDIEDVIDMLISLGQKVPPWFED